MARTPQNIIKKLCDSTGVHASRFCFSNWKQEWLLSGQHRRNEYISIFPAPFVFLLLPLGPLNAHLTGRPAGATDPVILPSPASWPAGAASPEREGRIRSCYKTKYMCVFFVLWVWFYFDMVIRLVVSKLISTPWVSNCLSWKTNFVLVQPAQSMMS